MSKKWLVLAGIFLFLIPTVIATQPTQNYNKIYISPFYLPSMTGSGVSQPNYTFSVSVNPPDGLSKVINAMVNFQIYISPTVTYTLYVNNKSCNNPNFTISTTFASQGMAYISFDCSNVITSTGNYTLKLSGNKDSSATYGWLDLTYMNNPKQENLFVSGTEYQVGDYATIFLQLKDSQGSAINNGNCYLDVYYPSYGNLSHPVLYTDVGMIYKTGSNGLYFFDMVVPNVTGVYMLGASCSYAYQLNWLFAPSETVRKPTRTAINGTYLSDTIVLNSFEDGLYEKCTAILYGGNRVCEAYYDFNSTGIDNFTALDLYYAGESDAAPTATFYVWNWTSSAWITLANTLTFSSTASASSPPAPTSVDEFVTNSITPSNYTINYTTKITRIRMRIVLGTTYNLYNNWLALKFLTSEGQIQELKGSGELHVSNALSNLTVNINQSQLNSILSAIASVNQTLNTTAMNYLIQINGTTFQINQSLYNDYLSLLTAINSVNATANLTLSYVVALNGSVFNLSIAELSHFNQLLALLNSINYTLNTTLEYKLDLINGTVFQINQSQSAYYLSLLGAIESVGATLNGSITQYLVAINGTTYNLSVNEYNHYVSILQAINSANDTQNWQYLSLLSLLNSINATGNTTLTLVASINQTLIDDIFVILKDINFTTNTTLEYKLDLINYTTWQSWVMLQNLTIGNVTVTASVNWTEGVPIIWNASGKSQVDYQLLSMSSEGIQMITESYLCLSNFTLQSTMNVTNCVQGTCDTYNRTATKLCEWGCANNQCLPQPQFQYMYAIAFALVVVGLMILVWRGTRKGGV